MKKNQYIEPENYFDGYKDSIKKNSENPEAVVFDKLCYMAFVESGHGVEFLKYAKENFIEPELVPIHTQNYESVNTYYQGFKQAFRMIIQNIKQHQQRIDAEDK